MFRSLVKCFQRYVVLHNCVRTELACTWKSINHGPHTLLTLSRDDLHHEHRRFFNFEMRKLKAATKSVENNESESNEFDAEEYIVPYRQENEKQVSTGTLIELLKERFRLSTADVQIILNDEHVQRLQQSRAALLLTLDSLSLEGISKQSIVENPWLLTLEKSRLCEKLALIKTLSIRDVNHFVPFLRLSLTRVRKLATFLKKESNIVPYGNRVYYISERLQVHPNIVTKYMPKRLFILEMPFEMLEKNLDNMITYKVSALDVLKDLWAFRYTPKSVQLRLERAKRARKNKIMPWMVRCPETILQRSLKLTQDELTVLNGKSSAAEYVAERLGFTLEETKAIMGKHPQVYRVRVTKVKEVLDYLLEEAGFTRHEIAQVPRILCHSLETTKKRFNELAAMNCRPSSLVILCRSNREYEKFKKSWQVMQENLQTFAKQSSNVPK